MIDRMASNVDVSADLARKAAAGAFSQAYQNALRQHGIRQAFDQIRARFDAYEQRIADLERQLLDARASSAADRTALDELRRLHERSLEDVMAAARQDLAAERARGEALLKGRLDEQALEHQREFGELVRQQDETITDLQKRHAADLKDVEGRLRSYFEEKVGRLTRDNEDLSARLAHVAFEKASVEQALAAALHDRETLEASVSLLTHAVDAHVQTASSEDQAVEHLLSAIQRHEPSPGLPAHRHPVLDEAQRVMLVA